MKEFDCTVSIIFQNDELPRHDREIKDFFLSIPQKTAKVRYLVFEHFKESNYAVIKKYENSQAESIHPQRDDLYDPYTLIDFFNNYVLSDKGEEIRSKRHILITWGHGAGLGFFQFETTLQKFRSVISGYPEVLQKELLLQHAIILNISSKYSSLSANLSIPPGIINKGTEKMLFENNITNNELIKAFKENKEIKLLTADTFNHILNESFGKIHKKIDLFLATSCYVQMLETGYSLKNNISYFIGSQIRIPIPGFDYTSLFKLLESNPQTPIYDLWENIRTNYIKRYESGVLSTYPDHEAYKDMALSISFNDLSYYDQIKDNTNKIAAYLTKNLCTKIIDTPSNNRLNEILQILRNDQIEDLSFLDDKGVIDYYSFLNLLIKVFKDFGNNDILNIINNTKELIQNASILYNEPKVKLSKEIPNGLSIFFPDESYLNDAYMLKFINYISQNTLPPNSFYNDSEWDTFLITITQFMAQDLHCDD